MQSLIKHAALSMRSLLARSLWEGHMRTGFCMLAQWTVQANLNVTHLMFGVHFRHILRNHT